MPTRPATGDMLTIDPLPRSIILQSDGSHAEQAPALVDGDDTVDVVGARVEHPTDGEDAGVVHQNVGGPELAERGGGNRIPDVCVGDVVDGLRR